MTNTAFRLLRILEAIQDHSPSSNNAGAIGEWRSVLKALHHHDDWPPNRVVSSLISIHDQVSLLEEELDDLSIPSDIYLTYTRNLKKLFISTSISGTWDGYKKQFNTTTSHIVHWAALLLLTQEEEIAQEDLDTIVEQAEQLSMLAEAPGVPLGLRKVLKRQAEELLLAINDYQIQGIAPLQKAMKTSAGDLATQINTLREMEASGSPEKGQVVNAIAKSIRTLVNAVDRVAKTSESVGTLYELTMSGIKAIGP